MKMNQHQNLSISTFDSTKNLEKLLKEIENLFNSFYFQSTGELNQHIIQCKLSQILLKYSTFIRGSKIHNFNFNLFLLNMHKFKIQLKNYKKVSKIPIYKQKYFQLRPQTILAFFLTQASINLDQLSDEEKQILNFELKVVDGQKGIFKIIMNEMQIKSKRLIPYQIQGRIVHYNGGHGVFWKYEDWEFPKMLYTYEFDEVISLISH